MKTREKILKEIARDKWITQKGLVEQKEGAGRLKMIDKKLTNDLNLTKKGIEWNPKSQGKTQYKNQNINTITANK